MEITPGYVFTEGEEITEAKLNQLGNPTVALEAGDVDVDDLDLNIPQPNYLRNGNFAKPYWVRGDSQVSCPVNQVTYRADWWGCLPDLVTSAGTPISGTVKYERVSGGPANNDSLHVAKLTGDTGIQAVDFMQDIPAHLSAALRETITVSFWLYNGTGASFVPTCRLDTADAEDNFTATTQRHSSTASDDVPTDNWQFYEFTFDCTATPNMTNGLRVRLRIPSASLNSSSKHVRFSQVKLEIGARATSFVVERDEVGEDQDGADAETVANARNLLDNPQFAHHRFIRSPLSCLENEDNYAAEAWFVRPGGADGVAATRATDSPSTLTASALQLEGASGVSDVDMGQNLDVQLCGMTRREVTFSIYVYNDTGAAFTPTLRIDTCDSANAFNDTTNRRSQSMDECPDGAWTRLDYNFNGSTITDWINGARIYLRIPNGSLDAGGKLVLFAQAKLETGTSPTTFEPNPDFARDAAPLGWYRNLEIRKSAATTIDVNADEIILEDAGGRTQKIRQLDLTVSSATSGANGLDTGTIANDTWYYLWVIWNGATAAGLLSLSASEPTLPAGYTYKVRVSEARFETATWRAFHQRNDIMVCPEQTVVDTTPVASNTYEAINVTEGPKAIPATAIEASGWIGRKDNQDLRAAIASDATGAGAAYCVAEQGSTGSYNSVYGAVPFTVMLLSAQTFQWKVGGGTADTKIAVSKFRLR
jgi:hypothetical protein